jgi:hypothetical protein
LKVYKQAQDDKSRFKAKKYIDWRLLGSFLLGSVVVRVILAKYFISDFSRQGSALSLPMPIFSLTATIKCIRGTGTFIVIKALKENA